MGSPLPQDPYKALNVPKDATLAAVRAAYRKLVLVCHPDKVTDEANKAAKADQFHQVQQAYELLSDDRKRARYDDQVKLAELRAEVLANGGGAGAGGGLGGGGGGGGGGGVGGPGAGRRTGPPPSPAFSPRSPSGPMYEQRDNVIYEERVPKGARRSFDDDFAPPPHFRRRDEDYYEPPLSASSRRSSGRGPADDRRSERWAAAADDDVSERLHRKSADKAKKQMYETRKKNRDKSRRQDSDYKRSSHRASVQSGSDSESDSVEIFMSRGSKPSSSEKRRSAREEVRRPRREEPARRSRDMDYSDFSDDAETYDRSKYAAAEEHISRSSGRNIVERRPGRDGHTVSHVQPLRPPSPPAPHIDTPRRSSAARRTPSTPKSSSASAKEKDRKTLPEIVEPPSQTRGGNGRDTFRRPSLASHFSGSIKIPPVSPNPGVRHAATMETRGTSEKVPSPLRRSQTSPLTQMASPSSGGSHAPPKSSRLRHAETSSSRSSSPDSPGYSPRQQQRRQSPPRPSLQHRPPPTTTTTSRIYQYRSDDDDENGGTGPRIVAIDPDHRRRPTLSRDRETSPRLYPQPHHRQNSSSSSPRMDRDHERPSSSANGDASVSAATHRAAASFPRSPASGGGPRSARTWAHSGDSAGPRPANLGRSQTSHARSGEPLLFHEFKNSSSSMGGGGASGGGGAGSGSSSGSGGGSTPQPSTYKVQFSPKLEAQNIRYAELPRRSSADAGRGSGGGGSHRDHHEAYSRGERSSAASASGGRHGHMGMGSRGHSYAQPSY